MEESEILEQIKKIAGEKAEDYNKRFIESQERIAVKDSEASLNQARLGLMNEKYNYISAVLDLETKLNIKLQNKK